MTCTFRHALRAAYRTAISAAQILVIIIIIVVVVVVVVVVIVKNYEIRKQKNQKNTRKWTSVRNSAILDSECKKPWKHVGNSTVIYR